MKSIDSEKRDSHKFSVALQFEIDGKAQSIVPFGSGHINDTYKLSTDGMHSYLLQRINHHVFKNVDQLMHNIALVTEHLHKNNESDFEEVLTPIKTRNQELYYQDEEGNYWRAFHLIENAKSYDIVKNADQAKEGGRAFGRFQAMLADLDPQQIYEVIPNFCHIGSRLSDFHNALKADVANRRKVTTDEIDFILQREANMNAILDMAERNEIPLRITHNDTKFNNVLLNEADKAKCVIDLDTVMPGYVAYDFGDAIRTIINKSAEDEANLDKITLNIPLFKAYTEGYFEQAKEFLTENEVKSLIEGVLLFPYMQAVRFLTDYLQGDTYYKIQHAEHNLQRTRAQIKLVQEIEAHHNELKFIIEELAMNYSIINQS